MKKFFGLMFACALAALGMGGDCQTVPNHRTVATAATADPLDARSSRADRDSRALQAPDGPDEWLEYPGVTTRHGERQVVIEEPVFSADGRFLTFILKSCSDQPIGLLWFRLKLQGAELVSAPSVVNGRGENIFVVGPLAPFGQTRVNLEIVPPKLKNFSLAFEFLEVLPRIAFSSDEANPGIGNLEEIFTLDPTFHDRFQVTHDSTNINISPVWSPGAEWIAFERLVEHHCPDHSIPSRPQIFIAHPDGSNLTQISTHLFAATTASFNPTGDLLLYDCRFQCDYIDTDIDICLFNRRTGEQTVLFSGDNYLYQQLYSPKWSPDGNYIVMNGRDPILETVLFLYAPVDPLTGDTIPVFDPNTGARVPLPICFMRNNLKKLLPDNRYHWLVAYDWTWAPDSKHAAIHNDHYLSTGGPWALAFSGQSILNFMDVLDANTLPTVPKVTWVANDQNGVATWAAFSPDEKWMLFNHTYNSGNADLEYIELENYLPLTGQRKILLDNQFYNVTAGPFRNPDPIYVPFDP